MERCVRGRLPGLLASLPIGGSCGFVRAALSLHLRVDGFVRAASVAAQPGWLRSRRLPANTEGRWLRSRELPASREGCWLRSRGLCATSGEELPFWQGWVCFAI